MDGMTIAVVAAAYLLGSVDFGVCVARLRGIDIYSTGSGNPGATNVLRSIGRGTAALVVVGDLGKGIGSAALGDLAVGEAAGFAAGAVAVVGHCFPVWHRLRGGNGVATTGGMILWLEPLLGIAMVLAWALLVWLSKRASVASLVTLALLVPVLAAFGYRRWSLVWSAAATVLVVARHHGNIKRLLRGAEYSFERDAA